MLKIEENQFVQFWDDQSGSAELNPLTICIEIGMGWVAACGTCA